MNSSSNLSRWALKHIPLIRYLMATLFIGGIISFSQLGQDEDPPFTFRLMVITAKWPGATAMQMAEQVTDKLEKTLQETPYFEVIHSFSKPGETTILLELIESASSKDTAETWYQVRKKIGDTKYSLPQGVMGPFFNDDFGDTYGSIFALSGDGFSYAELKDYADLVRQQFLSVNLVAKVELIGVQDEKVNITFSHKKFAQLGIPIEEIIRQINEQNAIEPAGMLSTESDNVHVRVTGSFKSPHDLENLVLRANDTNFKLGDFAQITREYQDPPIQKMRHNGHEVIGLAISMRKGGNVIELGRSLEINAQEIKRKLPVGIELERVTDQPKVVSRSVNEFLGAFGEALIIVLAVSFLSLGLRRHGKGFRLDYRPGLVVGLSIALVLCITFLVMKMLSIDLHKISLGALIIALGLLVDDAIITTEMMVRKMDEGYSRFDAAIFSYTSTAMPMLTGTLITAAGFLPIGLAKSVAGEYTFSIFSVNCIALLISWLVAVLFTPYLGTVLLKAKSQEVNHTPRELFDTPFYVKFRALVVWCVESPKTTIAITFTIFLLGVFSFKYVEQEFFPDSNRHELIVEMWLPEGSAYTLTEAIAKKMESFLQTQPEVENYTTYVATGSPRFYLPLNQIFPQSNVAQLVILPHNLKERDALRKKINHLFETDFPEVRGRVNLLPSGPPVAYPVQFRVSGADAFEVKNIAEQVKDIMRSVPGVKDVNDNWNESIKVLRIDTDQNKLRALGLTSEAIMRATNTVLSGVVVGQYREKNRLIDIQVRQPLNERSIIETLNDINIATSNSQSVTLSHISNIQFTWEPGIVWRENGDWAVTVQSDVAEGIQSATLSTEIESKLTDLKAALPIGYNISLAGSAADIGQAQKAIMANIPLVIFIIFTLLMLQLQSFSRAFLVFLTGPLGIAGVAIALLVLHHPMGFVAQLGVIALFGMIIRNSVILIDQIEADIADGVPQKKAIVEAAVRRFRPIILTAAAAILALIPLTTSVFWGAMAVAIMGGLTVATGLTLLFLPALYTVWFPKKTL